MRRFPNLKLKRPKLRHLGRRLLHQRDPIPYDMFDFEHIGREAKSARIMERIYHTGQSKAWDGKTLLNELVEKHGGVHLPPEKAEAIRNIFSIILWGELAAWKISAELAEHIEPLEAKLAATSQAHDEARHFYVMHDYLKLLGYEPGPMPDAAGSSLGLVLNSNSLAKKLVGMQLMVEPVALTLFQMTRESEIEPVLCELLRYYERDEARHVALGIHYLPDLIKKMNWLEALSYWMFQGRMLTLQLQGLQALEKDFEALGFNAMDTFRLGQGKQLKAAEMLAKNLGGQQKMLDVYRRAFDFLVVYKFPEEEMNWSTRITKAILAAKNGEAVPVDFVPTH